MSIEWTPAHRAAWEASWSEPHMKLGLLLMKEHLWPNEVAIPAGHDPVRIAASSYQALMGNNQVFKLIERLKTETPKKAALPQPNTPEARGIPVKRPE